MSTSSSTKAQVQEDKTPKFQRPSSSVYINLKITAQDGKEVHFRVKRKTKWDKLMKAYCQHMSIEPGPVVFLYDGTKIGKDKTIDDLEMEEGDEIHAMLHHDGGGTTTLLGY